MCAGGVNAESRSYVRVFQSWCTGFSAEWPANMKRQNQPLSASRFISRLGLAEELRSSCSECATWDGEPNEIHWRENSAAFFFFIRK